MLDILALLQCLQPYLTNTTLRQFDRIVFGLLGMTGRVTMLGIARWAGPGGSYRTVQRFFYAVIPWAEVFWLFFRHHLYRREDLYLIAGDEVVVTKAGKQTFGLDRFFSSLYGKPVPGLAFFTLSLVSVQERHSCPVRMEQVVRPEPEQPSKQAK
jgi:putative transposase